MKAFGAPATWEVIVFKIGDFSKLSRVSVKTLRYYDELGLLKPAHVDHFTGYRFYSADQLPQLNRILALKDLGFSLEQTMRLLEGALVPTQMREILLMKQTELHQRVQVEHQWGWLGLLIAEWDVQTILARYTAGCDRLDRVSCVGGRQLRASSTCSQQCNCYRHSHQHKRTT
jgi:DNA-binding transcriptional MerR regulator